MYAFEYKKVSSIAEAAQHLNSDTRLLAGGQTLLAAMKLRLSSPSELIDLQNIPNPQQTIKAKFIISIAVEEKNKTMQSISEAH
jgi:carbon-monoxide dehydrogenase medium subunit